MDLTRPIFHLCWGAWAKEQEYGIYSRAVMSIRRSSQAGEVQAELPPGGLWCWVVQNHWPVPCSQLEQHQTRDHGSALLISRSCAALLPSPGRQEGT